MKYKKTSIVIIMAFLFYSLWNFFVGYYESYIDHDAHIVYFIKKFPTFRREFFNPFANEGDPLPVNEMRPERRKDLEDYCKYRFGVTDFSVESLEKCKAKVLDDEL